MRLDSRPTVTDIFLYLRKSTRDADERQIRSINDQRQDCIALAERLNLTIVDEFVEDRSASRPHNRPVFKAMLKELSYKDPKRRRADGILAWHPDRLSRNALEAGMLIQMLDDEQIKDLIFPAYNFHNDTSGKEHLTIEFARAKGYTDRLSEVILRGVSGREREGAMIYPVKFGYMKRREVPEAPAKCSLFPIPHPDQFVVARRIFELALKGHSVVEIRSRLIDAFPDRTEHIPAQSTIDDALRDSFFCGRWVIRPGTKFERIINLREIVLPDGTTFQPIVTPDEFAQLQVLRGNKRTRASGKVGRRVNPFPGLIHCAACGRKMYPGYRKIQRANKAREEQLGYECHTRHDGGTRCPQGRIKADILYGIVHREIEAVFPPMTKRDYQRYIFALNAFITRKLQEAKRERSRATRSLTAIKSERRKIIEQRAALVTSGMYDKASKAHYETRLRELDQSQENLAASRSAASSEMERKAVSFRRFLELLANLHHDWHDADPAQKGEISKLLLLNLTIEGKETRSVSWNPLFVDTEKEVSFQAGGGAWDRLEPWFERLWREMDQDDGVGMIEKS